MNKQSILIPISVVLGLVIIVLLVFLVIFKDFLMVWTPNPNIDMSGTISIELNEISAGEPKTVQILGQLYSVLLLTEEMKADLKQLSSSVCSPSNSEIKESIVVLNLASTHRGCIVRHTPKDVRDPLSSNTQWLGGYIDLCSGIRFDYLGRPIGGSNNNQMECGVESLPSPNYLVLESQVEIITK